MGTLKRDIFICGQHVYKQKQDPGDQLTVFLKIAEPKEKRLTIFLTKH